MYSFVNDNNLIIDSYSLFLYKQSKIDYVAIFDMHNSHKALHCYLEFWNQCIV